jgi:hypothetical protein
MRKSLNQLFYTGLFIIFTPIFLIVTPIVYVKLANSVEPNSNSVKNLPIFEKKIVYDTVRVEIKVEPTKKNKKENFKKIDPPKLEESTISVEEKYIPTDSI